MIWIHGLSDLISFAAEQHELSLSKVGELRRMSTYEVYKVHRSFLQQEGYRDSDSFHDDFLVPMEQVFLQQNDELIAHGDDARGEGPAGALKHFQDLILGQVGHHPDEDLQNMFDALKAEGGLIEASQAHRDHINAIAQRLIRSGFADNRFNLQELSERLWSEASRSALERTGPAHRKQRGPKAGEPKKFEDAFGFNQARESLRKWTREQTGLEEERHQKRDLDTDPGVMDEETLEIMTHWATKCCTPTEQIYIRLKYVEGLSYGQIAQKRGVLRSTIQRSITNAKNKIGNVIQKDE
jgi:RNA polymerase sigma factor (sigma-70 family)